MTGNDFLDLAVELFTKNRSPNEAMCRTIVSRAYYGAFIWRVHTSSGWDFPKRKNTAFCPTR